MAKGNPSPKFKGGGRNDRNYITCKVLTCKRSVPARIFTAHMKGHKQP